MLHDCVAFDKNFGRKVVHELVTEECAVTCRRFGTKEKFESDAELEDLLSIGRREQNGSETPAMTGKQSCLRPAPRSA